MEGRAWVMCVRGIGGGKWALNRRAQTENNRSSALKESGWGGEDNEGACLICAAVLLSSHSWQRIFLSAWHIRCRKGTNSFVKANSQPRTRSQQERTRLSFTREIIPSYLCTCPGTIIAKAPHKALSLCVQWGRKQKSKKMASLWSGPFL